MPKGVTAAILETVSKRAGNIILDGGKGKCIEVSRTLCDLINKVEPNSAIVVCCKGFWRNPDVAEKDLHKYLPHHFVLYANNYFIDLTLRQFNPHLPFPCIRTVAQGHLGNGLEELKYMSQLLDIKHNQGLHQTYPEITDLNYEGLILKEESLYYEN